MRILNLLALAFLSITIHAADDPALAKPPLSITPDTLNEPWAVQWWMPRHEEKLQRVKQGDVDLLMIGDSITHGWENAGKEVWQKYYAGRKAVDLGFSGDRTENVIWRLQHGEVDGISPKLAVLMIGTNNAGHRKENPAETALGIKTILNELGTRLPNTKVLLLAIFPRGAAAADGLRLINTQTNAIIKTFADNKRVFFLDVNDSFLDADGTLPKSIMPDLLHPNAEGYRLWAEAMEPMIARLMGEAGFASTTIDFGLVVGDIEKSLAFYTKVVGFKSGSSITVQPAVANDVGLTDASAPITIHMLKLGNGSGSTTLKLMNIADDARKPAATDYIHSQLGMRYMTIRVNNIDTALAGAAAQGVKPLGKGPADLGGGKTYLAVLKDPDGNFVELLGPKGN